MCLCFHYLNNNFFLTPLRDGVYITSGMCLCFLLQFLDCVRITSVMCLCVLLQLRDCVCVTSVMCLCLLPQLRDSVSITPAAWLWFYYLSNVFVFVKPVTWLCFCYLRNQCFLPQLRDCVCVFTSVEWLRSITSVNYLRFKWLINLFTCGSNNVYFTYYPGNVSQQGHRKNINLVGE
jgi:hypothetical protein